MRSSSAGGRNKAAQFYRPKRHSRDLEAGLDQSGATLFISNDTGPLRIAAAVGAATINVSMASVNFFRETGPYGLGHYVVAPEARLLSLRLSARSAVEKSCLARPWSGRTVCVSKLARRLLAGAPGTSREESRTVEGRAGVQAFLRGRRFHRL
ncbi:MAG: hypothetical protein MZU91_04825 [Desulfosudis oleivorans]|nr:hypothetical protein [Desulfosudis oleivorans]